MKDNYISNKKEIKSEVETALIWSFLNLFSLDQIPQLRYSANAKYGMSFRCSPNNCFASPAKSLNSSSGAVPTNNLKT